MSLVEQSAVELLRSLESRAVSSVELTKAYLERIQSLNGRIGAFLRVSGDESLKRAAEVDARRARGESVGRLAGIPVAVKDIFCAEGEITTCASRMLEKFGPPYDSTVIARLRAADAVLIGRTNMDEFAMGGATENSAFQLTRNPWDLERTPGGSSGGSAAAVAAGMAPLAIGTDTGGSIRQPAGLCGVVGMKPTYGRVSRYGIVAYASSLDQAGPFGHSVEDVALLLETIAGHDRFDSTSLDVSVPPYSQTVHQPLNGLRIGWVREHFGPGLDKEVEAAIRTALDVFKSLGATIHEVSLPHSKYAVATYYLIAASEASSNLARYDGVHYGYRTDEREMLAELAAERKQLEKAGDRMGLDQLDSPLVRMYRRTRAEGFGPEVKRRIILGTYALSAGYYDAYYLKALKVRRLIRQDFDRAFEKVDLIAGPITAAPANRIGEMADDVLATYLLDLYTVSANLAGIPGLCLPCGRSSGGLPIGLQLQAPALQEERLLRGARMYEKATDWHLARAPIVT
ncbi:MAG TPA: Asp-tRNA(Asn)/Glu-tRNA(Gln) amidotransferase subunit GatA [Lacipirellulaceae bacterium]|jgi:aspartyl-tRNA(Asn)/glutamyl-tRNA(Gln) amidotransferase subunit A|nr:Asp-tRNA(Asn)/Glu-tRNA(Gln) amidotransferase subunit GatA [Lacipirellulaceae bacterium]